MMTKVEIAAAVERVPEVKPVLAKLAGKMARGVALPAQFSEKNLSYAAQRELEVLWCVAGKRMSDGRVSFPLPEGLLVQSAWRGAMEYFGIDLPEASADDEDVFARLKLLVPYSDWYVDRIASSEEVRRFASRPENRHDWLTLAKGVLERLLGGCLPATTLSQLGSDWFGDSKKIRTGALRRQLVAIYGAILNISPDEESRLLDGFGIAANPYTSCVTFCAPLTFKIDEETFDFPLKLYEKRMACQLPLETVLRFGEVAWHGNVKEITTSENASPFLDLVKDGVPCVYTEGYPNMAVRCLLRYLAAFKLKCTHDGDADLDGFRIAKEVGDCIHIAYSRPVKALYWAQRSKTRIGIPLTAEQRKRAEAFLAKDPDGYITTEVREMLAWGRWIEQESFGSIEGMSKRGTVR
ncbi:MAG: DUF2399 domain-containing protein [Kiritimatiellae bacterium]|nr:DUF2399 domain-containing protein [Kiritimatiellia bacterium]